MQRRWRPLAVVIALGAASAAAWMLAREAPVSDPAIEAMKAAFARPSGSAPTPQDNAMTAERVALGRQLFFDQRLSGDRTLSCASCHDPTRNWEDGAATALGRDGRILARATPTILNAAWGGPFFWDGRADTLEQQAIMPIVAPDEMNLPHDEAVARIASVVGYRRAFAGAYGEEGVNVDTISKALAAYQRSIVSAQAPFDRWIAGEARAISEQAQRGFVLFNTRAGCSTCHSGWRFTDDGFHDIGVGRHDEGRAAITPGIEQLRFAFKTPTLRNIDQRAPYMHDGSLRTLEEVVDFYATLPVERASLSPDLQRIEFSAQDRADIIAFLRTLTSDDAPQAAPTPM